MAFAIAAIAVSTPEDATAAATCASIRPARDASDPSRAFTCARKGAVSSCAAMITEPSAMGAPPYPVFPGECVPVPWLCAVCAAHRRFAPLTDPCTGARQSAVPRQRDQQRQKLPPVQMRRGEIDPIRAIERGVNAVPVDAEIENRLARRGTDRLVCRRFRVLCVRQSIVEPERAQIRRFAIHRVRQVDIARGQAQTHLRYSGQPLVGKHRGQKDPNAIVRPERNRPAVDHHMIRERSGQDGSRRQAITPMSTALS